MKLFNLQMSMLRYYWQKIKEKLILCCIKILNLR